MSSSEEDSLSALQYAYRERDIEEEDSLFTFAFTVCILWNPFASSF
jgi:hypothetical protein